MSTLCNVLGQVENLIGVSADTNRPLEWPKSCLRKQLQRGISTNGFDAWHNRQLEWTREEAKSKILERLTCDVAEMFRPATEKVRRLQAFTRTVRPRALPRGIKSNRHLVISAMKNIHQSFKVFWVVKDEKDLQMDDVKRMVLAYLRKVYRAMILLGQLLFPRRAEEGWFEGCKEYLETSQLMDFRFDLFEYQLIEDRTFTGVIGDQNQMPDCYFAAHPEPPVFYRNYYAYGPTILRNAIYEEQYTEEHSSPPWTMVSSGSFSSSHNTVFENYVVEENNLQISPIIPESLYQSQHQETGLSPISDNSDYGSFHEVDMQYFTPHSEIFVEKHAYQSPFPGQESGTTLDNIPSFSPGDYLDQTWAFDPVATWVEPNWNNYSL